MMNYLFEIMGEDSNLCGEQFFVQIDPNAFKTASKALEQAYKIARKNFDGEEVLVQGIYNDDMAEYLGYDTF